MQVFVGEQLRVFSSLAEDTRLNNATRFTGIGNNLALVMISSCNIFSIWRVTLINLNFGGLITCVCRGTLFELLELSCSQLNLI